MNNIVVLNLIKDIAADIVPTVLSLIVIIIPTGIILWAIGFAIKKGISYLQIRAMISTMDADTRKQWDYSQKHS